MLFELTDLLHLPISLCGAAVFSLFFSRLLGTRYKSKTLYKAVYSSYFLINATFSMMLPEIVPYLTIAVCFCFPLSLYCGTKIQRIICGGLLVAYSFVTECLTMVASSYISKFTAEDLRVETMLYFAGAYASALFLLCLVLIVTRRRRTRLLAYPSKYLLALLMIVWICAGLSFGDMIIVEQSGKSASLVNLFSELAITVLSVLMFFIFEHFQLHAEQKERTSLVEQQLLQEERRFMLIDEQHREVMAIKHDMNNHMSSLSALLSEGQYDAASEYLAKYMSVTTSAFKRTITGMASVDVLISEKITEAERVGIVCDIKSSKLSEILISPYHLNIILGNSLDNAIEACKNLSESEVRYISIGLKTEGDNLCFRVSNSSIPIDIPDGELPVTTKDDKLQHGFGLSTIERVAEHYGGTVLCTYSDGEFVLYVQVLNTPIASL